MKFKELGLDTLQLDYFERMIFAQSSSIGIILTEDSKLQNPKDQA